MGWHAVGNLSAYGEMNRTNDDGEDVTATFLLIGSKGAFLVGPFQLNGQSTL